MTVIAMTREMGTLGKDVAAGVSEKLGIEVVHHEIVERQLAERLQTSESAVHRFLEGEASLWERWKIDSKRVSRFTAEEVLDLAMRDNVLIRGWGAAQLLRDIPHVLCVRVCAPMANRIAEMRQRLQVDSADVARREIERNDEAHDRAVRRQFHVDWRNATGYDLVLNTGFVPIETAAAVLQQIAKSGAYEPSDASRAVLSDKLLEARVRSLLDVRLSDSPIGSSLGVKVRKGHVLLDGVVAHGDKLSVIADEIEAIDGVTGLTNDTVSVPLSYGP
ncbi:MAG: AAA family ATPase [Hyphomicrobiaceae bacterium]